jgi:hypothetical protein
MLYVHFPLISIWSLVVLIGNIHKLVDVSLYPRTIILFLYMTLQCAFVNRTLHPASQSTVYQLMTLSIIMGQCVLLT